MIYITELLITIPVLILSFSLHELSHGMVAYFMGDKTAKNSGRLSLNPMKHIDWLGFLFLIVARIGWAKPVPVNMYNFKDPKKCMAITALAGPLMNIVLAFLSALLYVLGVIYNWNQYVLIAFDLSVYYNAVLAMFNLLPIPPLDGSKVLFAFLPDNYYFKYINYEQYGMILILILSMTNMTSRIISTGVYNLLNSLFDLVRNLLTVLGVA